MIDLPWTARCTIVPDEQRLLLQVRLEWTREWMQDPNTEPPQSITLRPVWSLGQKQTIVVDTLLLSQSRYNPSQTLYDVVERHVCDGSEGGEERWRVAQPVIREAILGRKSSSQVPFSHVDQGVVP